MKPKVFITAILVFLFILGITLEIVHVKAEVGDPPITPPITSPEGSPSPSPSESASPSSSPSASPSATPSETPIASSTPASSASPLPSATPSSSASATPSTTPSTTPTPTNAFTLSGHVREIGFFHHKLAKSAGNITVEASNFWTGRKKTTKTDSDGDYTLNLHKGTYFVRAYGGDVIMSTPVLRFVYLGSDKSNINFIGKFLDPLFP